MTASQPTPAERTAWDPAALRDPHGQADKAARVQVMFDAIAPTYERVNRLVSLGRDAAWRRAAVAAADVCTTDVVLDVCCGTGDMIRTLAAHRPPPKLLIGVDFAARMLARGSYADVQTPMQLLRADGMRLPLADGTVDVVTCAFGVRNFQDLHAGLREMHRVLRPGGRVVILEFALPENAWFRAAYRLYCERLLPRVAAAVSHDTTGAYRYLPGSIRTFERRAALVCRLKQAGLVHVGARPLNLGGVVIYRGEKTDADRDAASPRPVKPEDVAGIVAFIGEVYAEYGCTLDAEHEDTYLLEPGPYFRGRGGEFWVVEDRGRIVATVAVLLHEDAAELKCLYVHRALRRRGCGRRLTELTMDFARQAARRRMLLWTDTRFLEAHRLYRRMGFTQAGTRELHDSNNTVEYGFEIAL